MWHCFLQCSIESCNTFIENNTAFLFENNTLLLIERLYRCSSDYYVVWRERSTTTVGNTIQRSDTVLETTYKCSSTLTKALKMPRIPLEKGAILSKRTVLLT